MIRALVHRTYSYETRRRPRSIAIGGRRDIGWLRVTWWGHCVDDRPQGHWGRAAGDPRYLVLHWHRLTVYLKTTR